MPAAGAETLGPNPGRLPALARVPGLVHGFGRRADAAFAGDHDRARLQLTEELAARGRLFLLRQVHGAAVRQAPWRGRPEADAATAAGRRQFLGIETADCLPILIVDPNRRAVAAVHAGWRGTAAGVARAAVQALVTGGSRVLDLVVGLGPAIGVCCYEVGEELGQAFGDLAAIVLLRRPLAKPRLDLRLANTLQLEKAGIASDRIQALAECTACRGDLYHSYRRDGPGCGRMISYVGFE